METDNNNNNQDSELDDPTVELEPLSEAACRMQAGEVPAEPDAAAQTDEGHETRPRPDARAPGGTASEIQRLRDELKYRADMNSILRHRNDLLREKCDELEEQVSSLLKTGETLRQELERSRQRETPVSTEAAPEPEGEPAAAESGQRSMRGATRIASSRTPETGPAPGGSVLHCLVLLDENGADSDTWVLDDGISTIGSGPDCDIRLQSQFVSRHHAQLTRTQSGRVLEDLDSTNGTYINARRIKKRAVRPGDLVTIGKQRLQYRERPPHLAVNDLSKPGPGPHSGASRAQRGR